MIGNDVVDIVQSRKESNWQRRGFLDKIFTKEEQRIISSHHYPETMVWMLWSMKEAAYKIFNRQTGIRANIAKQLLCHINELNTGTVTFKGNFYYCKTIVQDNCIYTVAACSKSSLESIYELQNVTLIKDSNGLPYIANKPMGSLQPVSVSHHGNYYKIATLL